MRSFLSSLVVVAVCAYSAQELVAQSTPSTAAAAPGTPPPAGVAPPVSAGSTNSTNSTSPQIVSMICSQAFMPISEADIASMNSTNGTVPSGNLSTVPTEAACKAFDDPTGGFCNPKSCRGFPVAQQCYEIIVTGPNSTTISNDTVAQVSCQSNYFKPAANETDQRTLCTDAQQKSYSCKGQCTGQAECSECVSMSDPALQNV